MKLPPEGVLLLQNHKGGPKKKRKESRYIIAWLVFHILYEVPYHYANIT